MQKWHATRAAFLSIEAMEEAGLEVKITADPEEVAWSVRESGKPYLTPWLDPNQNDFTDSNFFWIMALREGTPVLVGGGRLDDFGDDGATHMHRMFRRGYGSDAVRSVSHKVSERMKGRVVYLGDLRSISTTSLGRKNVRHFLGVANYWATEKLGADCTYSFMRSKDVRRGSADTNGFDQRIYQPVVWGSIPDVRDPTEVVVFRLRASNDEYYREVIQELEGNRSESLECHDRQSPTYPTDNSPPSHAVVDASGGG